MMPLDQTSPRQTAEVKSGRRVYQVDDYKATYVVEVSECLM